MKKLIPIISLLITAINFSNTACGMNRFTDTRLKIPGRSQLCATLQNTPPRTASPYAMVDEESKNTKASDEQEMSLWNFLESLDQEEDADGLPDVETAAPCEDEDQPKRPTSLALDPRWSGALEKSFVKPQAHDRAKLETTRERSSSCPAPILKNPKKKEQSAGPERKVIVLEDLNQYRIIEEDPSQKLTYRKSSKKYTRYQILEHQERRTKRRPAIATEDEIQKTSIEEENLFPQSTIDFSGRNLGGREIREVIANIQGVVRSCQDGVEMVESLVFDNNHFYQPSSPKTIRTSSFQNLLAIVQMLPSFPDIKHVSFCNNNLNFLPSNDPSLKTAPLNLSNPSHLTLGLLCYFLKLCPKLEFIDLRGNEITQEQHDEIIEIMKAANEPLTILF